MNAQRSHLRLLAPDQEIFKTLVDEFVIYQETKLEQLEVKGGRSHLSVKQMVEKCPSLTTAAIDEFIENHQKYEISGEAVAEIKKVFSQIRDRVNKFSKIKRFYILETMNFFEGQISLGKLIPAILLFNGYDQQRAIHSFLRPTFKSINKNIAKLSSRDYLFDPEKIHVERGILYTFLVDISKSIIPLFDKKYLKKFTDSNSEVDLVLQIIKDSQVKTPQGQEKGFYGMIYDSNLIRRHLLRFVGIIQSHNALYLYARKRHSYYKHYLFQITNKGFFRNIDAHDISRVFAGCLMVNRQLKPNPALIEKMLDPDLFSEKTTLDERKAFVDNLAPSTVHKLLIDIRDSMGRLSRVIDEGDFAGLDNLSSKGILQTIWFSFVRFIEAGVDSISEALDDLVQTIKDVYDDYVEPALEKIVVLKTPEKEEEVKKELAVVETKQRSSKDGMKKDQMVITTMNVNYQYIETDIEAFRGTKEGASQKDYAYTLRIFEQDEALMSFFHETLVKLFKTLTEASKSKKIEYVTQEEIIEYYSAFKFRDQMMAVGITHLRPKGGRSNMIEEHDIFPYLLLFKEGTKREFGRALSRESKLEGKEKRLYNETAFTSNNSIVFYEFLYSVLHLHKDEDWNTRECQECLKFLSTAINAALNKKGELAFLEKAPEEL